MPRIDPKRVAYLFGAGATNAELSNIGADLEEIGLLIGDVTRRVTMKAKEQPNFFQSNKMFLERAQSSNIELFISLIEDNAYDIEDSSHVVTHLKQLVEKDIKSILTPERSNAFSLHRALFELHPPEGNETIIGLISLNYDTILDDAYKLNHGEPDYGFSLRTDEGAKPPLLKLHGSFNWNDIEINGKRRTISIIPVGMNKNYLRFPYTFVWGRALEVLARCDILRVIGCSLSYNDTQLIDLLFKAHLEKGAAFEMQIISSEETGRDIRRRCDFFPKITTAEKIEETLMPEVKRGTNTFKEWLKAKGRKVLKDDEQIRQTTYLRHIIL
jgi:hypothetical protein